MKTALHFLVFIIAGAFFLMFAAFFNKYPIVYSDTSTYLMAGFDLVSPIDRPMAYGLFMRVFSLNGLSLWLVIFFQALVLSYLIFLLARQITGEKIYLKAGLILILVLSLFTSVSWTLCQLMPDIFTATALLSALLIIIGNFEKRTRIFLFILFFLSVIMHMSHPVLFILLFIISFFFKRQLLPAEAISRFNKPFALLVSLTIISVFTMTAPLSKSRHVFMMGAMAEKGILKKYLDDHCVTKDFKICAFKETLPQTFDDFVWKDNSPLYKLGGWKATKPEFNEIINGTLTEPKYIVLHMQESIKATFRQLTRFKIGDGNGSFLQGTVLHRRIGTFFPNEIKAYEASRQNQQSSGYLIYVNWIFSLIITASILFLTFLMLLKRNALSRQLYFSAFLIVLAILVNAWDCGTFSVAADRFGSKIIWMVPMLALLGWINYTSKRKLEVI